MTARQAQPIPPDISPLLEQGFAAIDRKNLAEAERNFSQAAALRPPNPWTQLGVAVVAMERRDMDGALAAAAAAEELDCGPDVLCKLGVFYKEAGEPARAEACLRRALALEPTSIVAWYNLRDLKKFTPGDHDIIDLEALAMRAGAFPPHAQAQVQFTLGKAYLDAGDADKAFARFAAGNALKHKAQPFNISVFETHIDGIVAQFDAGVVERLRGKGTVKTSRPIFIIGMPRSGSTLVDQILSSHPDVAGIGESRLLQDAIPVPPGARAPVISADFVRQLTPETLDSVARQYLAATEPFSQGVTRIVDKMLFNFIWAGLIALAFPDAKIIRCTRDPADMGLSIWRTLFAGNIGWAFDQQDIGRYYLAYEKLMRHWHALFPGRIRDVSYEALVKDPGGETKKLLEFCGLAFDARCLDFHKTRRRVSTASDMQVRRPVYTDSIGGAKKYAQYLKPLLDTLGTKP
jgi:tetratricopeptide (TPR) repeat protein